MSVTANGTITQTTWTAGVAAGGIPKTTHITELRSAIDRLTTFTSHVENCGNCTFCQTCQTVTCQTCQSSYCQSCQR